jgi:hypothetical protein
MPQFDMPRAVYIPVVGVPFDVNVEGLHDIKRFVNYTTYVSTEDPANLLFFEDHWRLPHNPLAFARGYSVTGPALLVRYYYGQMCELPPNAQPDHWAEKPRFRGVLLPTTGIPTEIFLDRMEPYLGRDYSHFPTNVHTAVFFRSNVILGEPINGHLRDSKLKKLGIRGPAVIIGFDFLTETFQNIPTAVPPISWRLTVQPD